MRKKIVIYTAAFGEAYGFVPQKKIKGVDFFCFTDDIKKVVSPWKFMNVKFEFGNNILKNRHPKLLPHLYFNNYDISIYIDSNFLIVGDIYELLNSLNNFKMATFDHSQSDDSRDCIYKEYQAILDLINTTGKVKDNPEVMSKQIAAL